MINLKEEKGITFIVLVITIVVMLILVGVSVNIGLTGISSSSDKQDMSVLYMVQQAALGQYSKAVALGNADKKASSGDIPQYVGEKVNSITDIDVGKIEAEGLTSPFEEITIEYDAKVSSPDAKNEDFYYRLKTADLKKLKITKPGDDEDAATIEETTDTYIVNYKTGEVYNETKQLTETNKTLLYIKGQSIDKVREEDLTSFTD